MRITHLTASFMFGGPERQMLGLAAALPAGWHSRFISFSERGRCAAFIEQARQAGFAAHALQHDTPRLAAAVAELTDLLASERPDVLFCHGYKSNLLGRLAARRVGVPVFAITRSWTGENLKVRVYEWLDRLHLHAMDHIVCVSHGLARKVRRVGIPANRLTVIYNSARLDAFAQPPDPADRDRLLALFPPGAWTAATATTTATATATATAAGPIVLAAGRLSRDKGFHLLVEAARRVAPAHPDARFVLFGQGPQRDHLQRQIDRAGLRDRFVLGGFRTDLDRLMPWADLLVLPSFAEGLPNVVLEAHAAGVPVLATDVGGNAELVVDGETGLIVPPGRVRALTAGLQTLLADAPRRQRMGRAGRERVRTYFTFAAQAQAYVQLLTDWFSRNSRLRPQPSALTKSTIVLPSTLRLLTKLENEVTK
jgi:glycosyltransferase involved in cell wall biosynthesis